MKRRSIHYSRQSMVTPITIDGIRFFKSEFPAGADFTYMYFQDSPYSAIMSTHVQTSGLMTGNGTTHSAGWCSRDDPFVIPYGPFTLTAVEAAIRWCCVGIADNEPTDYLSVVRVAAGEQITLEPHDNILVLSGTMTAPSHIFTEGKHVRTINGVVLQCSDDAILYKWNSIVVRERYAADSLARLMEERWQVMKSLRSVKDSSGFVYDGAVFDSDAAARTNITNAAQRAAIDPFYIEDWTLADNTRKLLGAAAIIDMAKAMADHYSNNHRISQHLRGQIFAATTEAEVNSVRWP